jgi:hypothetical protein
MTSNTSEPTIWKIEKIFEINSMQTKSVLAAKGGIMETPLKKSESSLH